MTILARCANLYTNWTLWSPTIVQLAGCNTIEFSWIGMLIIVTSARNVPNCLLFQKNVVGISYFFQGKYHSVTFKGDSYKLLEGKL